MRKVLTTKLEEFGISPERAAFIAQDVDKSDARSLWAELLMLGLWRNVIDETQPIELFMTGNYTVQRLVANGSNPDDLIDLVREVQVNAIYNIAQLIDWPAEELDLDETLDMAVSVGFPEKDGKALPIHELHACLMERDPSGRHGEPRSFEQRQFQQLPELLRNELKELILSKNFSPAALLWKKHTGGELKSALAAVQSLYRQL
ncbi:hypothetical protein [Massilia sp. YIM B04103]|uniref:hypothetical protein n=1 Tax=Massilia sp. YIM B04103 TaxID=2963106 RepID=UPI00210DD1A7|nr:hypothetical protein [Massilia sp. YIM B04103]